MVYDGDSVALDKQLLQLTKSSNISGQTVTATSGKVRVTTNSPLFDNFLCQYLEQGPKAPFWWTKQ